MSSGFLSVKSGAGWWNRRSGHIASWRSKLTIEFRNIVSLRNSPVMGWIANIIDQNIANIK